MTDEKYGKYKDDILRGIRKSMRIGAQCLYALFHDRMITDMSLRENTRPGLYAAGAYERLIKGYSRWIEHLSYLLKRMEGGKTTTATRMNEESDSVGFILAPAPPEKSRATIKPLFPLRYDGVGCLSVYEVPLRKMLEFKTILPILAHEIGHVWGILNRKARKTVWLKMVSYLFSTKLATSLRERSSYVLPISALANTSKALSEKTFNFFDEVTEKSSMYMRILSTDIDKAFEDFISDALNPDTTSKSKAWIEMRNALASLYFEAGALPMLNPGGKFFDRILRDEYKYAVRAASNIIGECYADLIAICTLDMSANKAVDWLVEVLNINKHVIPPQSKQNYETFSVRIMSALLITSPDLKRTMVIRDNPSLSKEEKENALHEGYNAAMNDLRLRALDCKMKRKWRENEQMDESIGAFLKELLKQISGDGDEYVSKFPYQQAWIMASTYLFTASLDVRSHFLDTNALNAAICKYKEGSDERENAEKLMKLRKLYTDFSSSKNGIDAIVHLRKFTR